MVAGLSSLMEPIIIVFLGTIIGGIVVSMYLPIFKLGQGGLMTDPGWDAALAASWAADRQLFECGDPPPAQMMERQWAARMRAIRPRDRPGAGGQNCSELPALQPDAPHARAAHPAGMSRWYENIPVLSYLGLRGRCSGCGTRISHVTRWWNWHRGAVLRLRLALGPGPTTLAWCGFSAALVALAGLTGTPPAARRHHPAHCCGPVAGRRGGLDGVPLFADAVMGAAAGYLSLWLVYWGFKLAGQREGMGYGDFKLFAALGAWFGWQALVPIILMASVIGAIVGIAMKLAATCARGKYARSPFLVGGRPGCHALGPSASASCRPFLPCWAVHETTPARPICPRPLRRGDRRHRQRQSTFAAMLADCGRR